MEPTPRSCILTAKCTQWSVFSFFVCNMYMHMHAQTHQRETQRRGKCFLKRNRKKKKKTAAPVTSPFVLTPFRDFCIRRRVVSHRFLSRIINHTCFHEVTMYPGNDQRKQCNLPPKVAIFLKHQCYQTQYKATYLGHHIL